MAGRVVPAMEQPIALDVTELARSRFLYDFSDRSSGLSAMSSFRELSVSGSASESTQLEREGIRAAFAATSLANFHSRHHDPRAESLARPALGRALAMLRQSLECSNGEISQDLVIMALLLGLQQVRSLTVVN